MNPQDLLIVARRFWPHSGLTELALVDLACNLKQAGHQVTLATVQEARGWCERFPFHDIPVVRFARPVTGPWSSFRYARTLAKHFARRRYDGIIASGLGDEAMAVIRAADETTPVVVRVDGGFDGVSGALHRKHVETGLAADAIIASNAAVANRLSCLPDMPRATVVNDGLPAPPRRNLNTAQLEARASLSDAHPVLRIAPNQPLVIAFTRLGEADGMCDLVHLWPTILKEFPKARLWIIGDGKGASNVWQTILREDLAHSVIMPGFFDDPDHLMVAGDLYIQPNHSADDCDGLLRAMSAGLPSVAIDNVQTRSLLGDSQAGWVVPPGNRSALVTSILEGLRQPKLRIARGQRAQQTARDRFPSAKQVDGYLQLLTHPSYQIVEAAK